MIMMFVLADDVMEQLIAAEHFTTLEGVIFDGFTSMVSVEIDGDNPSAFLESTVASLYSEGAPQETVEAISRFKQDVDRRWSNLVADHGNVVKQGEA